MRAAWLIPAAAIAFVAGWTCAAYRTAAVSAAAPRRDASRALAQPTDHRDNTGQATMSAPIDFESAWTKARPSRDTAAGQEEMVRLIEQWAREQPQRAMAIALQENNVRWRAELRRAALKGWATVSPRDALAFALQLPDMDNRPNIEAVLRGAAVHPDEAVAIGRQLIAGNAELAADYGETLIESLAANAAFDVAVRFAHEDTSVNRAGWINQAYRAWALHEPADALAAAGKLPETDARTEALHGAMVGWSDSTPQAMAEYAMQLPAGEERDFALSQALPKWVAQDPGAASHWLERYGNDPSFDSGILAIATLPALVQRRPDVSVEWASSITDPHARDAALQSIAERWARADAAAFARYLDANAGLRGDDRNSLTRGAQNVSGPSGGRG